MEVLILVSIILSLTQPILITDMRTSEFSYVILLDNSYSMEVNDVGMRRIDLAKKIARNFVNSLPYGSESALVTFAGDVKIIKGMDASSIRTYLSIDSIDISHVDGSNILNAIVSSSSLFGSREKKAILLISDGEFGMENLTNVLGFIEANNIKVDSILVGGEGGTDSLGRFHKTNKENLKALSTNSKGKFYAAEEVNFDSLISESTREVHLDLSYYFLLLSLIIFSLLWFLKNLGFLPS
ncbi:MAG: vWA domain-containing protein [Candidatus Pacearchaeota archaeon]